MKLNLCTLWRKRSCRSPDLSQMTVRARIFKYKELQKATKDFSDALSGSGCFGSVHRGMLPDSTLIAVKKLVGIRCVGYQNYLFESMQHINLVPLIGICFEGDAIILVYEYMPRRSLDLHLFQQQPNDKEINTQVVLDWNRRYQIALGAARGLAHLHRYWRVGQEYVHGNIKPENIILDSEFCPKLMDYCLFLFWRKFGNFDRILTTSTRGTNKSYIAPEALPNKKFLLTPESDVYSYGMVLFEMISGIRNSENGETPKSFPTRVASLIRDEGGRDILSVLDGRLARNADEEEVLRVCKVACWCIHDEPQRRPSSEQVVDVLEGVISDEQPQEKYLSVMKKVL